MRNNGADDEIRAGLMKVDHFDPIGNVRRRRGRSDRVDPPINAAIRVIDNSRERGAQRNGLQWQKILRLCAVVIDRHDMKSANDEIYIATRFDLRHIRYQLMMVAR